MKHRPRLQRTPENFPRLFLATLRTIFTVVLSPIPDRLNMPSVLWLFEIDCNPEAKTRALFSNEL